ncbi:MAG: hydrogenase maturation protease [Vicinamibacteria bacterium]
MNETVVIGIGNAARGDDGAGLAVARRLRRDDIEGASVVESDGDMTALLQAFEGRRRCILVDASRGGLRPGTVRRFEAHGQRLPAFLGAGSTHALGLADAIELARTLGQLPAVVVVYAIEGRSFQDGGAMSPSVRNAVQIAERCIRAEIDLGRDGFIPAEA